jgi:hypothetical protein
VITHQPVFMLGVIPALVWPNIRVEIEVTAALPSRPGAADRGRGGTGQGQKSR